MDDLKLVLIGGVATIIGVLFNEFKTLIQVISSNIISRFKKKNVIVKNHPIFTNISTHLEINKYKKYSSNKFKQAVIHDRENIFWGIVLNTFKNISQKDVESLSENDFKTVIEKAHMGIESYRLKLIEEGLSEKTLTIMEGSVLNLNLFFKAIIEKILNDSIFDNNTERLWVILSFYNEYLQYANKSAIDLLLQYNGGLTGEQYKGITNDGTY
jgi:hypothetical protein